MTEKTKKAKSKKARSTSTYPWRASPGGYQNWDNEHDGYLGVIVDARGEKIYRGPASFRSLKGYDGEIARRIVASVNACSSLPTDVIEKLDPEVVAKLVEAISATRESRK